MCVILVGNTGCKSGVFLFLSYPMRVFSLLLILSHKNGRSESIFVGKPARRHNTNNHEKQEAYHSAQGFTYPCIFFFDSRTCPAYLSLSMGVASDTGELNSSLSPDYLFLLYSNPMAASMSAFSWFLSGFI